MVRLRRAHIYDGVFKNANVSWLAAGHVEIEMLTTATRELLFLSVLTDNMQNK